MGRLLAGIKAALVAAGCDVADVSIEDIDSHITGIAGKAGGVKDLTGVLVRLRDGKFLRFLLKRVREDGRRVKEGEGIIALYRQGRFDATTSRLWLFDTFDVATGVGIGEPQELALLEPLRESPLLANLLVEDQLTSTARTAIGGALGSFLLDRHLKIDSALDQYIRELIGGSFGLMATLDAYPIGVMSTEDRRTALEFGVRWADRLAGGRATAIHGDFHPWNVFVNPITLQVDVTGGLHTSYGLAEDDLACMATNLYVSGESDVLAGLVAERNLESSLFGFFIGWRLLVLSNPRHYPQRDPDERRRLTRAALFALAGERLPTRLDKLLALVLGPGDPWIRLGITADQREDNCQTEGPVVNRLRSSDLPEHHGETVDVAGRVLAMRRMKQTVFADLDTDGCVQVAIPRPALSAIGTRLRPLDLIGIRGRVGRTRTGEMSVLADKVTWLTPCRLDRENARAAIQERTLYEATSSLLRAVRRVLEKAGFKELVTGTLRSSYEGGRARPFATWSHASDRQLYLRVTSEIALKAAVARGLDRVYEIGPMFRNEAEDGRHLPEFLMLEAYAAYMGLDEALDMTIDLLRVAGGSEWVSAYRRVGLAEAILEDTGLDIADNHATARFCAHNGIAFDSDEDTRVGAVHSILRRHVAPPTKGLLVIEGLPEGRSPLSHAHGQTYSRAWVFVNGISVADVAIEESSLDVVRSKLKAQFQHERLAVTRNYVTFLEALALGVPPCVGIGMSLSRVLQALMGLASIRGTRLPC